MLFIVFLVLHAAVLWQALLPTAPAPCIPFHFLGILHFDSKCHDEKLLKPNKMEIHFSSLPWLCGLVLGN